MAGKLALLPFQSTLNIALYSSLTDCGLMLLLSWSAWQASRRSAPFARALWLCMSLAFAIQTAGFGVGAAVLMRSTYHDALSAFWSISIISYLIAAACAAPLLLSEEYKRPRIDWLWTLDIAQLGLLLFTAFLVFFYIPVITGLPNALRPRYFFILHLARDGFFAAAYLYRGWRSQTRDFRRLQFRLSAFFGAFTLTGSLYWQAVEVWHWPQLVVGVAADLPIAYLLLVATTWQQEDRTPPRIVPLARRKQTPWRRFLPLIVPFSIMGMASQISPQHFLLAWMAVTVSFAGYAARSLVIQHHENVAVSRLTVMEEKFSKVFRSSPVAISISRLADGKYLEANDRWLEMIGLPREATIGKTSVELGIFSTVQDRNVWMEELQRNGPLRQMDLTLRIAGQTVETLVSAEVIDLDGESVLIASMLDVTQLRNVTQQLHQAQKMELVGSLAGGLAHDFNNLLTIIKGYCELARDRRPESGLQEDIHQIVEAADRAGALTRQLLAFSRRQVLQPRNVALNPVVAATERMLRRTLGVHINLTTSFAPDLGTVHVDPAQIDQVVMNLAINARDAMPKGGRLVFETKNMDLTAPYVQRGFEIAAGRYVVLTVTDTGMGILPEHLERIFEPFFTTKEAGRGTGLGLSTVYGIIRQSGGYVSVYSEPGLGTTFNVYLPRVDQPAETFTADSTATGSLEGTETVLVVEDDVRVCKLTADILGQHGYRVVTANSGEDAFLRTSAFEGTIDLLLTDIVMARTSGPELAQRLKEQRPGLRVLYMSGYPHFALSGANVMDYRETILPKPFTPSELVLAIRTCLDREVYGGAKGR